MFNEYRPLQVRLAQRNSRTSRILVSLFLLLRRSAALKIETRARRTDEHLRMWTENIDSAVVSYVGMVFDSGRIMLRIVAPPSRRLKKERMSLSTEHCKKRFGELSEEGSQQFIYSHFARLLALIVRKWTSLKDYGRQTHLMSSNHLHPVP